MKLYSTVASRLEAFTQMIGDLRSRRVPALCVGLSAIHKAHFLYAAAMELDKVKKATEGMTVVKTILVKDKLMNLIVKPAK